MPFRDGYSGKSFQVALAPQEISVTSTYTGETIDLRGYEEVTFVLQVGATAGGGAFGASQRWKGIVQIGYPSDAGVSVWSDIAASQVLHNYYGEGSTHSTVTSGVVFSIDSADYSDTTEAVGLVGLGEHRYARVMFSEYSVVSTVSVAVLAILGHVADWPVAEPAGIA